MILKVHIQFPEYRSLMFKLAYRKPVLIALVAFDLLMIAWIVLFYSGADWLPEPEYPQYLTIFLISIVQPVMIYLTIRSNYRSSSRLHESMTIEFAPDTFKITGKSFYTEYKWDKTFRIQELKDWFLIYQNTFAAKLIPKRSLSKKGITEFRTFVKTIPRIDHQLRDD